MKQVKIKLPLRMLTLASGLLLTASSFAQSNAIKGQVKDASGEPVMGATITVNGKAVGITDMDGNFSVDAAPGTNLTFTYLGMTPKTVQASKNMIITMIDDSKSLNEVVVIGYGRAKKNDLTGAVTAIKPDDMNHGLVTNAQDMMNGKIAGVNVISNGGTPGGGSTIRIRGGASLSASNDPLIVIDGLAMDNNGVQGLSNPLSMVNPNDIESFTVLKDASATAIYGSRASNGVIIITTKKGSKSGKIRVSYNGNMSISSVIKRLDVMDGDEYRSFIANVYGTDSEQYSKLGNANTDWQKEIFRDAFSTDHNVSMSGNIAGQPFRASLGATIQNGVIKTSTFSRLTGSLSYAPSFFDKHLNVNANLKGMWAKNRYADGSVVGDALTFDPTQPVYADGADYMTSFGGYFQWTGKNEYGDASWPLAYNNLAQANPVSTLDLQQNRAISRSLIGNLELDYKFHFLPDLRIHINGGMDLSKGRQTNNIDPRSASNNYYGYHGQDVTDKYNLSFSSYLQYAKELGIHNFDIMGGYEWQHFHRKGTNIGWGMYPETHPSKAGQKYNEVNNEWANESYLVSFFGRLNYTLMDRYMLTATFRADGSSKFNKDNRWGYFPSVALAWKLNQENFLKDVSWLSDLKLRAGYGITGQQEGVGEYTYFKSYTVNREHAFYPIFGSDDTGITSRPNAYNLGLTWEKTTTWNAGLDFGALNGRFNASVDFYYRKTKDLLQNVTVSAGTNFKNSVMTNVGELSNTGVEFSMGGKVIQKKDFTWDLQYNVTWNKNKILSMTTGDRPGYYIPAGGISQGTGNTIQGQAEGHPAYSFLVYQQVYDKDGKPLENVFVDRNGDGIISDADRYYYKKPAADVLMGLSSKMIYKDWDFSFSLRASLNNYVYNDVYSNNCNQGEASIYAQSGFFTNFVKNHLGIGFKGVGNYYMSDLFVQNASFLKCDNITLGYSFRDLWGYNISGRVYGTVQNVFTITNYKGLDPEVSGGIDNNIYPRPFVAMIGLSLNF